MEKVEEIEDEERLDDVLKSPNKVVVFYYWDMCPHCQVMHKPYDDLAKNHKDVKFVKVESKNIPEKLNKGSFPEFELRENKKTKKSVGGEMSKEELESKLFGGSLGGRRRRTRSRRLRRRTRKHLH
jgi:thiol-disulfide isomerase/thioredoxin